MKRAFTTREKVMLLVLTVLLIVIAYFAFDAYEPNAEGA